MVQLNRKTSKFTPKRFREIDSCKCVLITKSTALLQILDRARDEHSTLFASASVTKENVFCRWLQARSSERAAQEAAQEDSEARSKLLERGGKKVGGDLKVSTFFSLTDQEAK